VGEGSLSGRAVTPSPPAARPRGGLPKDERQAGTESLPYGRLTPPPHTHTSLFGEGHHHGGGGDGGGFGPEDARAQADGKGAGFLRPFQLRRSEAAFRPDQ